MQNQPTGIIQEAVRKETKDLYLAAALDCEGCRFIEMDRTDPRRMVFVFDGGDNADRVEKQWWEKTLVVSAVDYSNSIRKCKTLIHS